MKLRVHFRLVCRRGIVLLAGTASAMAEVDGFYHFDDPVGLDYGHEVLAPMKGGARVVDWNRDGLPDIMAAGGDGMVLLLVPYLDGPFRN